MNETKNGMRTKLLAVGVAALLLALGIVFVVFQDRGKDTASLRRFGSYEQLRQYVEITQAMAGYERWGPVGSSGQNGSPVPVADGAKGSSGYSSTNVQVAGVDEADIVKTDGEYLYAVSGANVTIARIYPAAEAGIASRIAENGTINGLFLNGNSLVVFVTDYGYTYCPYREGLVAEQYEYREPQTLFKVYDINDRCRPALGKVVEANGTYMNSRMVGDWVYAIVSSPLYGPGGGICLPSLRLGNYSHDVAASEVGYFGSGSPVYGFTVILSVHVKAWGAPAGYEVFLAPSGGAMYASHESIYLTETAYGLFWDAAQTLIHKVGIKNGKISYCASASVPGFLLNQFSMDESGGYLRVATTSGNTWDGTSESGVYVFGPSMNMTGKLEGLGKGESIYSVRFMGDRCYLVTFKKVDPFFVIDLANPFAPKLLGELKIPGYSDYLHPYDESHVIGVGKNADDQGDFAWYQGMKLSLFDVSDLASPKEDANFSIGDRGTGSEALYDHKAFLFDREKGLLVLPVSLYEINESQYPDGVPPFAYGELVWEGAYVFGVTTSGGFALRGGITHEAGSGPKDGWDWYGQHSIRRSLYIGETLYTVSEKTVMGNSLADLSEQIVLGL